MTGTIVGAAPGYYVAQLYKKRIPDLATDKAWKEIPAISLNEVIAWKITPRKGYFTTLPKAKYEQRYDIQPITLFGEGLSNEVYAIKCPDGTFDFMGSEPIRDETEFTQHKGNTRLDWRLAKHRHHPVAEK